MNHAIFNSFSLVGNVAKINEIKDKVMELNSNILLYVKIINIEIKMMN